MLQENAAVAVQRALWLAGGSGRVMQNGRCFRRGGGSDEGIQGFPHQPAIAQDTVRLIFVSICHNDVLQSRQLISNPQELPHVALSGQYGPRAGITESVEQRLLAEIREQRAGNQLQLEPPQQGEIDFRGLGQENEKYIAGTQAQFPERVGES